jgi:uncharacterized protein
MHPRSFFNVFSFGLVAFLAGVPVGAQPAGRGMSPEAQEQIHALFDGHEMIQRTVVQTKEGYTAVTESDDPKIAAALQKHVSQMAARLESGLQVRRWDPAFEEYVAYYGEMTHAFEKTDKGMKATVKGKTPLAIKVAQNHAVVVSAFAAHGWSEHDKRHPAVKP